MFVLKAAVKKVLLLFTRRRSTKLLSNRTVKMIIVNFVLLVITPLITRVISTNAPMGPLKVKSHKKAATKFLLNGGSNVCCILQALKTDFSLRHGHFPKVG